MDSWRGLLKLQPSTCGLVLSSAFEERPGNLSDIHISIGYIHIYTLEASKILTELITKVEGALVVFAVILI